MPKGGQGGARLADQWVVDGISEADGWKRKGMIYLYHQMRFDQVSYDSHHIINAYQLTSSSTLYFQARSTSFLSIFILSREYTSERINIKPCFVSTPLLLLPPQMLKSTSLADYQTTRLPDYQTDHNTCVSSYELMTRPFVIKAGTSLLHRYSYHTCRHPAHADFFFN